MRAFRAAPLLALSAAVVPLGVPAPLPAQAIEAVVLDEERNEPVAAAAVELVDAAGVVRGTAITDSAGRAVLPVSGPGSYFLHVAPQGYLSTTRQVVVEAGEGTVERVLRMPLISSAAARVMGEVISRETAFQLPLEELCGEPLRPWEAGVLVGVVRDRGSFEPVGGALLRLDPVGADGEPGTASARGDADRDSGGDSGGDESRWRRLATETGGFWFCNIPAGEARVVTAADGFRPDTFTATIRAGSISWYDALLRRRTDGGDR